MVYRVVRQVQPGASPVQDYEDGCDGWEDHARLCGECSLTHGAIPDGR